jgi:hypothetical protein
VREGDTVTIGLDGGSFDAECTSYETRNADPRTGEVRETRIWMFDAVEYQPVVTIIDGLKSSPDDPDFPVHNPMYDRQQEYQMGYIENLTIDSNAVVGSQ